MFFKHTNTILTNMFFKHVNNILTNIFFKGVVKDITKNMKKLYVEMSRAHKDYNEKDILMES